MSSITVDIERAPTPVVAREDAGFSVAAPAACILRYCYSVSNSDGAAVELKDLKLPADPFRWTTTTMDGSSRQEFRFEQELESLRDLERRGDTLHVWAAVFLPGKAPSVVVALHVQLRFTPKMDFHDSIEVGKKALKGVGKENHHFVEASGGVDALPDFLTATL